ncbi:MAG: hypothetical protein QF464_02300 [Myxococcota bacterium]|nr:hypothetical protein [Myxococcota bacterium]
MRLILLALCLALTACTSDDGTAPGGDTTSPDTDGAATGGDGTETESDVTVASDATPDPDSDASEDPTPDVTEDPTPDVTDDPTPDVTDDPTPDATDDPAADAIDDGGSSTDDAATTEPEDAATSDLTDLGPVEAPDAAEVPEDDATQTDGTDQTLLCHILCDDIWESCGGYGPYGTDQDTCVQACVDLAAVSLDSLVAVACMHDTCDEALCDPGDTPFSIHPQCTTACDLFEACDMLDIIQPDYPDLLDFCYVGCSSSFMNEPEFMPGVVECAITVLEESCDPTVVDQCIPGGPGPGPGEGPNCVETCDIAVNFNCPPWEDGPSAWPDDQACLADCQGFEDDPHASSITMYGCAVVATCDGLEACTVPPVEDSTACETLCQKAFSACGDFMPSMEFCVDYCTGQLMIFGDKVPLPEVNACIDAVGAACEEDPFGARFGCLLQLEEECDTICGALSVCNDDPAGLDGCLLPCNAGYMNFFGGSTTAENAACIEGAAGDCAAVDACMAGPQPPPCFSLCASGMACEPNQEMCTAACETKVADGALADVACEYADQCETDGLCEGLDIASAPAECVDACASVTPDTCEAYPGGCVAACQGLFIGSGGADPTMPFCMAPQLGESCFIEMAYWNCMSF